MFGKKMSKGQLTGMAGVYFVAAEASLRGLITSPTSRGAMAADLLITDTDCRRAYSLQVKTNRVTFKFWLMSSRCMEMVSPTLVYALVNLRGEGPEYFIVPSRIIAEKIVVSEASETRKHTWHSLYLKEVEDYRDAWDIFQK
jgi:hypothetical protein